MAHSFNTRLRIASHTALVLLLGYGLLGFSAPPRGVSGPFRIDGKPPTSGYLTHSIEPVPEDLIAVPMIRKITGVFAQVEPRAILRLRRAIKRSEVDPGSLTAENAIAIMHLHRGDQHQELEVYMLGSGNLALRSVQDPSQVWGISEKSFTQIGVHFSNPQEQPGEPSDTQLPPPSDEPIRFVLPHPYIESSTVLDPRTIRSRIKQRYPALTRELPDELFRVRLPKNYNQDFPAGVLVWISPMPDGRIPRIFEPVLDELGLIAIGIDNNGNKRELTDRLQNHLDSIDSVAAHYLIDRDRIYLTGMSGGGRCSGILQLGFPEIFDGAVPIVGLDTYHNAPTGDPGKYWPARLAKPAARWMKLIKTRRIAAITGTADFNKPEMLIRQGLLKNDGIDMRLDIIDGMAHAMPTAEAFSSALDWVDEPRRTAMVESFKEAKSIMADYSQQFGDTTPTTPINPAARTMLIKVIALAPWTEPAWKAAGLLGYPHPD